MINQFGYARLVRINDERGKTWQAGLDSCSWNYHEGKQLSRRDHIEALRRLSWPYNGLRIVGAGTHGGQGQVMFGVCRSTKWMPYDDEDGWYHSQIDVEWEDWILFIRPGTSPSEPLPRSNKGLTLDEYNAWRRMATPLMDAATQTPRPTR